MKSHRITTAAAVLALAVTPAAALAKKPDNPGSQGKGHAPKAKNVVVKGVVTDVSATSITVAVPGKGKGSKKDASTATFVLDANTKLTVDANGIQKGDKVVVQAKGDTARHVVDQTHPPADEADEQEDAPAPAPVVEPAPAPTA